MYYQTLYQSKRNKLKNWIGETKIYPYVVIVTFIGLISVWLILLCI